MKAHVKKLITRAGYIIPSRVLLCMLTTLFCGLSPFSSFSQGKQANNWYFGNEAGITFQQGSPPIALTDGKSSSPVETGTACISDENGNLLFYSDGKTIWNKNHDIMTNGNNMGTWTSQGGMIVQDPGNENRYYFFNFATTGISATPYKFQYSVIDMANGIGEVLPDQKGNFLYLNTSFHLSAVLHENMEDVWVVTHGLGINGFLSFRVTDSGVVTTPEISYAGTSYILNVGYMKISSDGKWLGVGNFFDYLTELYHFDNSTGIVSNQNVVTIPRAAWGVEFSPDNTKFYAHGGYIDFYQYDLTSGDPVQIAASGVQLANDYFGPGALQLGPDGKIYVGFRGNDGYLGVIHDPDKKGRFCNFEFHAVYLDGKTYLDGLPVFMQSYMRNPEFTTSQYCSGSPTQFNIVNTNGIDSVYWKFKDFGTMPNDTSTQLSPAYTFSGPGTYYPELTVYSGLLHKTVKDTVVIYPLPTPQLGRDTLFCPNTPINLTLNAGSGDTYNWNGNFTPGSQTLAVTDTGTYFVRVRQHGCSGYDTIQVGSYPPATVDITNAQFNNSNCNQADGSITGMVFWADPSFDVVWHNAEGIEVGNAPDLLNVPAGSYTATVNFGSSCSQEFGPYSITDNNATQITDVLPTPDHCNQGMGGLSALPASGNPADFLYSLNGAPYQANGGVFPGLTDGEYHISLKDAAGCISNVYTRLIENIPGPEIHCFPSPATGSSSDGRITVVSPNTGLTYQLEGGLPQTGNIFTGLAAQIYYVLVTDAFGCTARDTVEVESLQGSTLVALAGINRQCLNKPASSNIRLARVSGLKQFKATLYYNAGILNCTNFNSNEVDFPGITAQMFTAPARVEIAWNGSTAVTNTDTLLLGSLIFETTQPGLADINWEHGSPMTWFLNEAGDTIQQPALIPGNIQVHEIPEIGLQQPPPLCEGDNITLSPGVNGGTAPIQYAWTGPQGSSSAQQLTIPHVGSGDSGLYHFTVSDYFNCADTTQIMLSVVPLPQANFPTTTDTVYYEQQTQLQATPGYASYQWNTGDTTYFINITEEGDYSVLMQTTEGCSNLEKVTLIDTWFPFNIPNAFTPNGDGLNDTFRPVTDYDRFSKFSMVIYNSWGQKQFETTKPADGWNGKDAAAGVYVWVITYADYLGKVSMLRGSITVVR